ncbi:hypothetical protein [Neokomagataea thailandica]|nr:MULTISPECIES: hypothetical protein [Neokomagataea]
MHKRVLAIAGKATHRRILHAALAAIMGYVVATGIAAICAALLPLDGPQRALSGMFAGFIAWPCTTIAGFGLTRDIPQLLKRGLAPMTLLLIAAFLLGWRL